MIRGSLDFISGDNHQIIPAFQPGLVPPENFPQKPFRPVSFRMISDFPAGDRSQPIKCFPIFPIKQNKATGNYFPAPVTNRSYLFPFSQPLLRGQPIPQNSVNQGINRFRPLARLRLITALPAAVDIRLRNPWVRERLILLG